MDLDKIKHELERHCRCVADILGMKQGSIEIHCKDGRPKRVHVHDVSIKFEEHGDGK